MSMLSGRGSLRRGCCGIRKVRRLGWLRGKESAGWNGDGWIKEKASICGVEGYGVVVVRGTQCRGAISERDGRLALDLDDAHSRWMYSVLEATEYNICQSLLSPRTFENKSFRLPILYQIALARTYLVVRMRDLRRHDSDDGSLPIARIARV